MPFSDGDYAGLSIAVACLKVSPNRKDSTPEDAFNSSIMSVVELKAESEKHGTAYGSAVCIDDHRLVTNAHIVTFSDEGHTELFSSISIRPYDSDDYIPAKVIGYDVSKDLCALELTSQFDGLKPINISNNFNIQAGQRVFAVGNAMNHGIGITEGVVSIPLIKVLVNDNEISVIQCNITVANGSSGGALLNDESELIGITTFRLFIIHSLC